jgi:saccharopine dehydrogenase-like NADP-dependent oxidoreductase
VRVLVLGCGEMGETAVRDLYEYGPFDEITVATRTEAKAAALAEQLSGGTARVVPTRLVMGRSETPEDVDAVARIMDGFDVVVNCVGPNYRYEVRIARAAIRAGVDLVDINDDYETTLEMLELDAAASGAGITIVLGLGASPGVNNVLVRAAADRLDTVEEIRTAWVMAGSDPGGPALSYHLLKSLSDKALTVENGKMVEVESLVDGAEILEFPDPVGPIEVFHVGHPEPITLSRTFPDAHYVDDKASFNVPVVNELIRDLGHLVREAPTGIALNGGEVDAMDFAALYLHRRCKSMVDVPKTGALRVELKGKKGGKTRTVHFSSAGRLSQGTGIPASIGAMMLVEGKVPGKGVRPPEDCIDAREFLYEIFQRRDVAELNGWVEDE